MLHDYDIVCVAPGLWDESWLDVHRYMLLLAKSNRILLIERAVTPISFAVAGQRDFAWRQIQRSLRGAVRHIQGGLYVATPPLALPLRYENIIVRFNHWVMSHWLKNVLQDFEFSYPTMWLYEPNSALLISSLNPLMSLYMVTDDYASAPSSLNRASQIRKWERTMLETVDLVVSSESHLTQSRRRINPNTHTIGHGVDHDLFSQALDDAVDIPSELSNIQKPVIGLIGRINQRIDTDIIQAILERDWQLVMVGALGDDHVGRQLAQYSEIIFTGYKNQSALPAYLKVMDVCIIPYRIDVHTQYMHPLKALEYLAGGRPVVSTPLPALIEYHSEWIAFANTPDAFTKAVEQALTTDNSIMRAERSRYASAYTWTHQLEQICELIERQVEDNS